MSEYQYYEFQAIDRSLTREDQAALRALSTRARITATSFVNVYNWGDFKGDPMMLMRQWFDLHLYFANWGSRHLMIRLPAHVVDRRLLDHVSDCIDGISSEIAGDKLILNIERHIEEGGFPETDEDDDGSGWLAALAPLRADLLAGDERLFYLLWLMAVEEDAIEPDEPEPLPGIGPLTGTLEAFINFFGINPDLAEAAAERRAFDPVPAGSAERVIAAMDGSEKNRLLLRLLDGDPLAAVELRAKVRAKLPPRAPDIAPRSAADLLARAEAVRAEREQKEAKRKAEQHRLEQEKAQRERRARLDALIRRGEAVWQEIETEIERRNASGYNLAAEMLADMEVIANERGKTVDFARRLADIRSRHERKKQFLMRIEGLG